NITYDFENWIGYFVPYRQGAGTAFSRFVPGSIRETYLDHIYRIKTQTWSTKRIDNQYGSRWIIDPNRYTLSEGDMVAIKLLPNAPEEMFWVTFTQSEPPRTKDAAINFSYKEELDYTPIFIELDPNDLPEEVGIYVAGICKGAAVVDSALIEVNYYTSEAKEDSELEIMFYYGDKGMKKAPAANVYNPETMLFEAGSLKASSIGEYGYISFNRSEGSSLVPLVTELKQNYPNPFKNQTNFSWILAKDAPVSLDIYNLKGQKVKTLFSGMGVKGRQMAQWNGRDENNREVASGVYFYRLNTPEGVKVHKMMVLK
ncbi:MAG: T9SS type A sorting domain-containing protein, partial [Candidatus Cloacimonetes bacterium]|nr:T9SS type A sorting domain-containing protein [Candidatus Cloacimonadota bacterium]